MELDGNKGKTEPNWLVHASKNQDFYNDILHEISNKKDCKIFMSLFALV